MEDVTHLPTCLRRQSVRDTLRRVGAARTALAHLVPLLSPPLRAWRRGRDTSCRAHHALNVLADPPEPPNVT